MNDESTREPLVYHHPVYEAAKAKRRRRVTAHTSDPDTSVCSVCDQQGCDLVECRDWPGRFHHDECARDCVECKGAAMSARNNW